MYILLLDLYASGSLGSAFPSGHATDISHVVDKDH
jgi:hypothetical protein